MVLGHHPKSYRHMMKNMLTSLIIHEQISTTHGKAKHLLRAANKLINFAKRAGRGETSPINLLKGRVATEQALKKLMMETVPKLESIPQNYVLISKKIHRRRGDNAPVVTVTIRNSEKEETTKMQAKELREKTVKVEPKNFCRKILGEEKAYYEQLIREKPEMQAFFKSKLAKVEFDQWALDKPRFEKRLQLLV